MKKICALIVTYNNAAMLERLLHEILGQNRRPEEILVLDNDSRDGTAAMIKEKFSCIGYIRLPENVGTAGGFHEGIKQSMGDYDFIWTLDDDVHIPPDSLEELIKGFEILSNSARAVIVRSVGKKEPSTAPRKMDIFTWRGSLIKTDVFHKHGLPKKEFFIYGEDLEFSFRLAKLGYSFYWIPASECIEKRKDAKNEYRFFGRKLWVYREPFRLYYAFRNSVYVYLRYFRIWELIKIFLYGVKVAVCFKRFQEEDCGVKIKAVLSGIYDGVRGRLGKVAI